MPKKPSEYTRKESSPLTKDFKKAETAFIASIPKPQGPPQSSSEEKDNIKPSHKNPEADIDGDSHIEKAENERREAEALSFEEEAQSVLTEMQLTYVRRMGHYIFTAGHTQEEAALLSGIDYDAFEILAKEFPVINKIIQLKELMYKHTLMRSISRSARQDERKAEWLLERRFPEEFAKKRASSEDAIRSDIFSEAVRFVQENGDSEPLISGDKGREATNFAGDLEALPGERGTKKKTDVSPEEWLKANTI